MAQSGTRETLDSQALKSGSTGGDSVCTGADHPAPFRRLPVFLQLTHSNGEDTGEGEQCSLPVVHDGSELLHLDMEDCGAPVATTTRHPVTSPPPATRSAHAEKVTTAGLGILGASELVSADQCSAFGSSVLSPAEQCSTFRSSVQSPAEQCSTFGSSVLSPAEQCSTFGSSVLSPAEQCSSLWADCLFLAGRHHGITSPDSTMPWDESPEEGLVLTESTGMSTGNSGAARCKHFLTGSVLDVTSPDSPGADHTDSPGADHTDSPGADHINSPGADHTDAEQLAGQATEGTDDGPNRRDIVKAGKEDSPVRVSHLATNCVGDGREDNFVFTTSHTATTDYASNAFGDGGEDNFVCTTSHTATTDYASNAFGDGGEDNFVCTTSHTATTDYASNAFGDGGEDNFVCTTSHTATTDYASNAFGDGGEDNFVCTTSHTATRDCASRIPTESDLLQLEQDMDVDEVDEVLGDGGNTSDSDGCGDGDSGCEDDAGDRSDTDDTEAEWSSPGVFSDLLGRPKDSATSLGQCVVTTSVPSYAVSTSTSPSGSGSSKDVTNTNNISSKITTADIETTNTTTTCAAASRRRHSASPARHVVERKKKNTRPSGDDSVSRQQHPQCSVYKRNEATERFSASSQEQAETPYRSNGARDCRRAGAEDPETGGWSGPAGGSLRLDLQGCVAVHRSDSRGDFGPETDTEHVSTSAVTRTGLASPTKEERPRGHQSWGKAGETAEGVSAGSGGDGRGQRAGESAGAGDDSTNDGLSRVGEKPALYGRSVSARPRLVCHRRIRRKDKAERLSLVTATSDHSLQNTLEDSRDVISLTRISDVIEMQDVWATETERGAGTVSSVSENKSDVSEIRTKPDVTEVHSGKSDVISDRRRALKRPFLATIDVDAIIRILQQCDLC